MGLEIKLAHLEGKRNIICHVRHTSIKLIYLHICLFVICSWNQENFKTREIMCLELLCKLKKTTGCHNVLYFIDIHACTRLHSLINMVSSHLIAPLFIGVYTLFFTHTTETVIYLMYMRFGPTLVL